MLSRELEISDFEKLKSAYFRLTPKDEDESYRNSYKLLFFQHFLTSTLKDETLRKEILEHIPTAIWCAFENDILKSAHDFIVAIVDKGLNNFKAEVNKFFIGLTESEHKNFLPVYNTLFDTLKTRQNRFDFLNLIDSAKESIVAKVEFGNLIINEYSKDVLTETETLAIQNIKELQAQLLKEEKEVKQKAEADRLKNEEIKRQREEKQKQQ